MALRVQVESELQGRSQMGNRLGIELNAAMADRLLGIVNRLSQLTTQLRSISRRRSSSSSRSPPSRTYRAPTFRSVRAAGLRSASAAAHWEQNFAPGSFSCPQLGQTFTPEA